TARADAVAALSGAPGSPGRRSRWVVGRLALDVRRPLASLLLDGPVVGPSSPPVARPATDGRRLPSRAPGLAAAGGTPGRSAPARSGRDRRNDDTRRHRTSHEAPSHSGGRRTERPR